MYPDEAKKQRIEGKVWLSLLIDTLGNVAKIEIERSDNALLNDAAVAALREARFTPARFNGVPEAVWYEQALTFKLTAGDTTTTIKQRLMDGPPVPVKPLAELFAYPPDAMAAGIEGSVELQAMIDSNGKVSKVEILRSSLPAFEAAALGAMANAEFLPAIENGKAITSLYRQALNYTLPSRYVEKVFGMDTSINAPPELLDELPIVRSKTVKGETPTAVRILVGDNGQVKNALALDKNVDAETMALVLNAAYKLPFAPGLRAQKVSEMWTDVMFIVLRAD